MLPLFYFSMANCSKADERLLPNPVEGYNRYNIIRQRPFARRFVSIKFV